MPPLPGAEREVREASQLFPLSQPPLLKGEAQKSFVVADLPRVDFAHLAVHTAPLRKGRGLLLASSSDGEPNSDLLLGEEISRLDLQRLSFVALPACRSATPGDSVFAGEGLVEPFLEAGARAVIASPRAVSDSLSPELWGPFYHELRSGRSPAAALRNAQLECLHSTDKDLANPAFWAGFAVYHGNLPMKGE
jgi:CHAT domain-containing protein